LDEIKGLKFTPDKIKSNGNWTVQCGIYK